MRHARAGLFIFTVLLSFTAACGPVRRSEPTDLFWPSPPAQPRIQYVQSIYTEDDIGRRYSFFESLFGKDYDDRLYQPYGVFALGRNLLVTDLMRQNVLVLDFEEKRLSSLDREGVLKTPAAAVEDAGGNIYVANASDNRVIVFDAKGAVRSVFTLENGRPVALALNEALGRLYVVDRQNHAVAVMDLAGKRLFTIGRRGIEDGQFNIPLSIALDTAGNVYVLDSGNFRVQKFDPDGRFLLKFGSPGDRHGQFSNPKGIAVDSEGHIYVTDASFSNFQIFSPTGAVLLSVGRIGASPGYFYLPCGIAIDAHDRIYVADRMNGRVEVFQYLKEK